jgi:hypothetical protein
MGCLQGLLLQLYLLQLSVPLLHALPCIFFISCSSTRLGWKADTEQQ